MRVIDVDGHVYEPEAIWDRHVPAEYQAAARSAFFHALDDRGNAVTVLNGHAARELSRTKLVRQAVWRPGMTPEAIGALDPSEFHPLNPGASDPVARLADLDALGIDEQIVFPTLFAEYFPLVENPDAARVLARAYNDWIFDFCSAAPDRLHPVAVLPLSSVLFACRELERVAAKGFKAVFIRPMFYRGSITTERGRAAFLERFNDDPVPGMNWNVNRRGVFPTHGNFRPLWSEIEAAGLVAAIHPSCGSASPEGASAGTYLERVATKLAIGHPVAESVGGMQDAAIFLVAMAYSGLLEDFSRLRLAVVHGGATILPLALEKAETYLWILPQSVIGMMPAVSLEPAEVFAEHPTLVSFDAWETGVGEMHDLFAAKAAWGSRYPHHDASSPGEAIAMLESRGVPRDVVARLMGGNARELFGLGRSRGDADEARSAG